MCCNGGFNSNFQAAAEYLVRVSFGTALIASIVLVYTTIIALISSRRFLFSFYKRIIFVILIIQYRVLVQGNFQITY